MTQIKKVKTSEGVQFYPQTHTKAVIDDNGYTAESRLQAMQDEINQAQLEVGAVPSDLAPTEDSTNWVTSGGVYNALTELAGEIMAPSAQVNLASYSNVMFTINASGVWATTTNNNHSIFVPMEDGEYTLTASSSTQALYTVLTSNATPTAGATPAYATGYSNRISIPAGGTITVQGTSGLYLWMRNDTVTTGAMPPTVMFSSGNSRIDDIEIGLGQLEDEIASGCFTDINAPLTFTSENASGYIMRPSGDFVASSGYVTCDYYYIGNLVGKVIKVTTAAWVSSQSRYDNAVIVYNASKGISRAFSGRTLAGTTTSAVYTISDYEITVLSGEAYIRINSARSTIIGLKYEGLVKEKVNELSSEIENIKGSIQTIPDLVASYEYTGKRVEIEKHRFAGEFYMSFSATGTIQGGASYDNYYVISSYDSSHNIILTIYDLSTKTSLGSVNLGIMAISNTHANTVVFSSQFHTEGDTLPVLYICSGYGSETTSQVYAYRLVYSDSAWTATLVQTITLSSNATISWAEFVPDNENGVCWIKTDAWYRTSLPLITTGDVTIDMASLTAIFPSPSYTGSGQGHLFYNDKIYFPSNISGGPWHLNVLDTISGRLASVINIGQFYANEPEHCFIYDSHLYVGYQGKNVYKLYFD